METIIIIVINLLGSYSSPSAVVQRVRICHDLHWDWRDVTQGSKGQTKETLQLGESCNHKSDLDPLENTSCLGRGRVHSENIRKLMDLSNVH